jgi:hypothetical protein
MTKNPIPTYKGRRLGIVVLIAAQLLIGGIHVFFGLLLLALENLSFLQGTLVYDVYTVAFGILTVVFSVLIWQGNKIGWIGTIAVSLFVIGADSLTLLNLPSIPGIPKFAGFGEITYSALIIVYLCTRQVRTKFLG